MKQVSSFLRRSLFWIVLFSIVINVLTLIPALYMIEVFDRVLVSSSQETLLVLLVGASVGLGLLLLVDYTRARLQHITSSLVAESLQPKLAEAMFASGEVSDQRSAPTSLRQLQAVQALIASPALTALIDAPWLFVFAGVIGLFHPWLGIASLAAAFLMLIITVLGAVATHRQIRVFHEESGRANRYFTNAVRAAEAIYAHGIHKAVTRRWHELASNGRQAQDRIGPRTATFAALSRTTRQFIQVAILSLGAYLVVDGRATPGVMIATTILLGRALAPMEQVIAHWRVLAEGFTAYRALKKTLKESEKPSTRHLTLPAPAGVVHVQDLAYRLEGSSRLILQGITFSLIPGESLAVVGPTAAGKSTLARLLVGLAPPSMGSIRLDGADVSNWPREELGPGIGYLPQQVHLLEGTIADNISRMTECPPGDVIDAARLANVHDMILALPNGYDTVIDPMQPLLSPGQSQRIGLARALFRLPRFVVLDEPNSNLDAEGDAALIAALKQASEKGVTVVVITHRANLLQFAQKVLVLQNGRPTYFGPSRPMVGEVGAAVPARPGSGPGPMVQPQPQPQAQPAAVGGIRLHPAAAVNPVSREA